MRGTVARALRARAPSRRSYRAGKEAYKAFPLEESQQPKLEDDEAPARRMALTPVASAVQIAFPRPRQFLAVPFQITAARR